MNTIQSINPVNNKVIKEYPLLTNKALDSLIDKAHSRFQSYKSSPFSLRKPLLYKAAEILESNSDSFARTISLEMGKTVASSKSEVEKCAWVCRYYADNGEGFLADEPISTDASSSMIAYRPLGVILAVMPWNYPFWQVFRFAAPALMAGNVCLLKHASNVPECALLIEKVFLEAGFPLHTFSTALVSSSQVKGIIQHPYIKAVSLTGSELAGKAVASLAGENLKKCVLELGGSDPYIVLEDADLDLAADLCVQSRLLNAGQSCIGAKRFIVVADVYHAFLEKFKSRMQKAKMGDPFEEVDLGPMARMDLRNELHNQVQKSIELGANCMLGGEIPDVEGAYYPPTILTEVQNGMPAYSEELFGPVASVIKAKDEEEAIRIANDTSFGLGSCVFTKDLERGERIAKYELDAGCCFVNQFVKSDPRLPFGGIKSSGYGRELSHLGIREFVNIKTVYIK